MWSARILARLTVVVFFAVPAAAGAAPGRLENARTLLRTGEARAAGGAVQEALVDFTRAIAIGVLPPPEQARALLARGLLLDGQGRLRDALGDYDAALKLAPRLAPALNNRGNVYRRQGRLTEARRDYEAALSAGNPAPQYSWFGLGRIAEAEGRTEAARQFYRRALAADPGYADAASRMAALGPEPPVILRPPRAVAAEAPVKLRPPPPAAAIAPAAWHGDTGPSLRPALDRSRGGGTGQVQLGAWRTEEEAAAGWNQAVRRAGAALSGLAPHIVAVDLAGRGRFYRLRLETGDPVRLCAALSAKGQPCMLVRN